MNFAGDSLTWIFASAATLLSAAVLLFGEWYFDANRQGSFRLLAAGCWAAFLGALFAGDWLVFVVFVELSTLALWRMIAFRDRKAATLYLLVQLAGAGLVLIGAAGTSTVTGTVAMGPAAGAWRWFMAAGFGVKSAFPLLHFWLPEAHSKAPAPASAMLSGFTVKLGIYGMLRAFPEGFGPLPAIGVTMVIFGGIMALFSTDLKRLLAYSTMSHLGFMTASAGIGAVAAAALYAFVHALFKGLLFLAAGVTEKAKGTRDLASLRGIARTLPGMTAFLAFGAFASSGFPLSASYIPKGAILASMEALQTPWLPTALKLSGTLTAAYLLRAVVPLVTGRQEEHPTETRNAEKDTSKMPAWAAMAGLTALLAASGFFTAWIPGITASPPVSKTPFFFYLLQAATGFALFLAASRACRSLPCGLPDTFGLTLKTTKCVFASSDLLARMHGGLLNFYALVVLFLFLVLMLALCGWW